jgi:hypothetical protein
MIPHETPFPKEHLEKCLREVEKLREMGITEYAIVTYLVRVREGRSKERALNGLLEGRASLTREQKRLVRTILDGLPIR